MKKRLFIIENAPLNEPLPLSVYLTGLVKNYKIDKNYDLNLIVSKSKEIPKEIKETFNKIYQIDSNTYSIKSNIKFSKEVYKILKEENKKKKIDILHCFYPNSSLLGAVLFKLLIQKNTKILYDVRSPWIDMSIERGFINKRIEQFYKLILYTGEKILGKFVNSFMFVTQGLADYYKGKIKIKESQKIYDSPSGVDLEIFKKTKTKIREKYGIPKEEILVGSIGGITSERKPGKILEIFAPIIKKKKNVSLMLIGGRDPTHKLRELANKLVISKKVIFIGNVPHDNIPQYISAFDYGLCHLPDNFVHQNNFSLKILEYLACEVPVLASKIKSNNEISKKLKEVYIYKDSKDIEKILKGRKKFKSPKNLVDFSWPSIAEKYFEVYDEI